MKMKWTGVLLLVAVSCLSLDAWGEMPQQFYFEDYYYVSNDVPYNGYIGLQLQIYNVESNGACLYEDSNTVEVVDGLYVTLIGDDTVSGSLSNALASGEAYVQVVIDGTNLFPREPLIPVPYALTVSGLPSNSVTSSSIAPSAVQTSHIADEAVSADKLASDVDDEYVNVNGDTMAGILGMGGNEITNVSSIQFSAIPSYVQGGTLSNYYGLLYYKGEPVYISGNIIEKGFFLGGAGVGTNGYSKLVLRSFDSAYGQPVNTNYTVSISTTTNVMNEILITGHLNMQGSAISNAMYSGDASGLTNFPTGEFDALYATVAQGSLADTALQPNVVITVATVHVEGNTLSGSGAAVAGGSGNTAGINAFVGGGTMNYAYGSWSVVGGGRYNIATSIYSSVVGGTLNNALASHSFIGGGGYNIAYSNYSAIAGGYHNYIHDQYSFIGGGMNNVISNHTSVIGGGQYNMAAGVASFVGGGWNDYALSTGASVGGGGRNEVSGDYGAIAGGFSNKVAGAYGMAGGYGAQALHSGSWVWADSQNGDGFSSVTNDEFAIRAANGVRITPGQETSNTVLDVTGGGRFTAGVLVPQQGDISMGIYTNGTF